MTPVPADLPPAVAAARDLRLADTRAEAFEKFALRTRSPLAADVAALAATGGVSDLDGLLGALTDGTAPELGPVWGAVTARVLALGPRPDAWERATDVFEALLRRQPAAVLSRQAVTTWAQLLLRQGRDDELRHLLDDADVPLAGIDRWSLGADLVNPWRMVARAAAARDAVVTEEQVLAWLAVLNQVCSADGLEPVELGPAGDTPYQRLSAIPRRTVDGELVTVVMSAYRPDRDILTAARSVLAQTWRNVELLVVDDASPPGSEQLLEEVAALDERVRVVRAPRNAGTYEARNLALATARGRWLTFQDSDDWTHPRRVEVQVGALLERPRLVSCRTWTLRAYPDLTLTYVGYPAERLNASSLLLDRLETVRLVGAFDATRKSGDMELPLRLEAVRRGSHTDVRHPAPLAITQLRGGSLSRTDAVPGWTRWTRLAYRDLYLEWHRRIRTGRASPLLPAPRRPFPLPDPTWAPERPSSAAPRSYDVVVLGDLRAEQPRAGRTVGVATALASAGLRTALAHAEVPDPLSTRRPDLLPEAMSAVTDGRVGLTDADEPDGAALLVVTDPAAVLHLATARLVAAEVLVLADGPPSDPCGWSVPTVDDRCCEIFGRLPRWGGPLVSRPQLRDLLPPDRRVDEDLLSVVDIAATSVGRGRPGLGRPAGPPVVGHHLPDRRARWPRIAADVLAAYPAEGLDARFLQGVTAPTRVLGSSLPPASWCSYAGTGMTPREFLSHLDVFVYQGEWDDAAEVATLEALAAGLPCVLPEAAAAALLRTDAPGSCDHAGHVLRFVPPAGVRSAVETLVERTAARPRGGPAPSRAIPARRLHTWLGVLRSLTDDREITRGVLA